MNEKEAITSIEAGDTIALEKLLDQEPELVDARHPGGHSLLMHALYYRQQEAAARIAGRRTDMTLHEQAALGLLDSMKQSLSPDSGAVHAFSPDGFTPLHLAVFFARPSAAELLLKAGADPSVTAKNDSAVQPLHSAVAGRNIECVRLLVDADVDLDAKQTGGYTALMSAAANDLVDILDLLVEAGASLSVRSEGGATALDLARQKGAEKTVARLEEL